MEALALAVATAVIQYLVDKTDLLENVRGWLKRDPASLAYQRALLRAYAAFARSDPALAKSFFDETFLARAAIPELAKQLTRHEHANSAELARLWAASLYGDAFAEKRAQWAIEPRVVQACAQFLQWLENELKREEVFQPLVDSRALEALEAKFDELARVLTNERNEALRRAETYEPVINQIARQTSVNISDHSNVVVYGDLVGGDKIVHNYFYGNFTSLDDYYIAPDSVYQRVKIDEFVGREWLVSRLDAFLNDTSRTSGVFRIEGEAGVGKTSFLAHLVRTRGYLHLFAEQAPGDNNVERALLSLGAQIVSRYRLDPYVERNTLPANAGFSDFLYKLLNMASQRLTAGEKIIVVCDALDEAGNGTNGNVFGLPTNLPDNVYFILSQRPVSVRLEVKCDLHNERVKPDNADNLHDMEAYLRGMATRPQIAQQLRAQNYSAAEFVRVLQEKSGGVWMYLYYVLDEIQRGSRHPLGLDALPNGLVDYYLAYWGDWRAGRNHRGTGESEWYALYLSLLTTLAAAQEPIPLDTLITWAGVNGTQYQVRNLVREQWRAFITESKVRGVSHFALYHTSLRDFLTGKGGTNALSSADGNFIDELRDGTHEAHKRIVLSFEQRCAGVWTDLIQDEYAQRYLILHLQSVEQYDALRELIAWNDTWAKARYDKEETWSNYRVDLERVWAFAEQAGNIGWQIRCALIESTIHSLVGNIFPKLLAYLVKGELWKAERALADIPHMPDDVEMTEAVKELLPLLPGALLGQAFLVAQKIQNESDRSDALELIIKRRPAELMSDILNEVRRISDESEKANLLHALVDNSPLEMMDELVLIACAIVDERLRIQALRRLAENPHHSHGPVIFEQAQKIQARFAQDGEALLEEEAKSIREQNLLLVDDLLGKIATNLATEPPLDPLEVIRQIKDENQRSRTIQAVVDNLTPESGEILLQSIRELQDEKLRAETLQVASKILAPDFLEETLILIREIQDQTDRTETLLEMSDYLEAAPRGDLLNEAVTTARGIEDRVKRVSLMTRIADKLPGERKESILSEALQAILEMDDKDAAAALNTIIANLNADESSLLSKVLYVARGMAEINRARALRLIAIKLSNSEQNSLVREALAAARQIENEYWRMETIVVLVDGLPHLLVEELLTAMREINTEQYRVRILRALIEHSTEGTIEQLFSDVCGIKEESMRGELLYAIAEKTLVPLPSQVRESMQDIKDASLRVKCLSALARKLPPEEARSVKMQALGAVQLVHESSKRVELLGQLKIPVELKDEALKVPEQIADNRERIRALLAIADNFPAAEQKNILQAALLLAREIGDTSERDETLDAIRSQLGSEMPNPEEPLQNDLTEDEAIRAQYLLGTFRHCVVSGTPEEWNSSLEGIVSEWREFRYSGFDIELWQHSLRRFARQMRRDLLVNVRVMLPVIQHFGKRPALEETKLAIQHVGSWWH